MNVISSVFATEKQFQAAAFKCLNNEDEFIRFRGLVHHIPNENLSESARLFLATQGVIPGPPDLSLPFCCHTFYAELKMLKSIKFNKNKKSNDYGKDFTNYVEVVLELQKIKESRISAKSYLSAAQKAWHATYEKTSARIPIYILFPEWDAEHGDWLLQVRRWGRMVREFVR